jgi:phage tail sheath protein FI
MVSRARAADRGALHHPWVRTSLGGVEPPDGSIAGQLSASSVRRGPWAAVANRSLPQIVGVDRTVPDDERADLVDAGVNVVLRTPRGVMVLSDRTLSVDPRLGRVSARRLLCLLVRAASWVAAPFVFEVLSDVRSRALAAAVDDVLARLLVRGAFAGSRPDDCYRVVVDRRTDAFVVELRVAPAVPLEFVTVRLVGSDAGVLTSEGA